jgi:hypothetical protein
MKGRFLGLTPELQVHLQGGTQVYVFYDYFKVIRLNQTGTRIPIWTSGSPSVVSRPEASVWIENWPSLRPHQTLPRQGQAAV